MVHHIRMAGPQQIIASLTPLEQARTLLCDGLAPVAATPMPLAQAEGCIAAGLARTGRVVPEHDIAMRDGWAFRASDLVGASSYAPVPLTGAPKWVNAGDALPSGCDCVIEPDMVEQIGPLAQAVGESTPGANVRRAGEDIGPDDVAIAEGRRLGPLDLLIARALGLATLDVRRPRLRIVNVPSARATTTEFIAAAARRAGADVIRVDAPGRDAASIASALDVSTCDLVVMIGGTGAGHADAAVTALAQRGEVQAHGIALQPGRSTAVGRIGACPVVALPGASDQALAAWLTLARPALDRLSGHYICAAAPVVLPLARKIASGPGMADIVLVRREDESWQPIAVGDLSLRLLAQADGWLAVPGDSEGYAAGTPCGAMLLDSDVV
jgi:molybdopterin biosynthesis enzyme